MQIRERYGSWLPCYRESSVISDTTFRFLNEEHEISFTKGWEAPGISQLWLYNLHYFDDLVAEEAKMRLGIHTALIKRWIFDNAEGLSIGWDSYPCSLRITNWAKWLLAGNQPVDYMEQSLCSQAAFLERRLEYHLQGNHLWANGKALLFAGTLFEGKDSNRWLDIGRKVLIEELDVQILNDGGHFERSPMYHAIILEDILDIVQLAKIYPGIIHADLIDKCMDKVPLMFRWLSAMSFPDMAVSFFNDSVSGVAPKIDKLLSYSASLGIELSVASCEYVQALCDTGFVRVDRQNLSIIVDVGKVGPDFQPGHAHADTLSFEMCVFGDRFIVNSGIDQYGMSNERSWQRSTAAHSTVEIESQSSSEVWGGFRVARRAEPFDFSCLDNKDNITLSCSHDGYARLEGRPVHNRTWIIADDSLKVSDSIVGECSQAKARFYLHPNVEVRDILESSCILLHCGHSILLEVSGGRISISNSSYHPEFGISLVNQCVEVKMLNPYCVSEFTWQSQ